MRTTIARMAAALSVAAAGVFATTGQAQMLDQAQDMLGATFSVETLNWQQEIQVGLAGQLAQIDIYVTTPGSAMFYVGANGPWASEPYDFVLDFDTAETGWHSIDVSSADLVFDVGDTFALGMMGTDGGLWIGGGYIGDGIGPYPGDLWVNGVVYPIPGWDFAFHTWVVPAPGALAIFGLTGLIGPRRRRA